MPTSTKPARQSWTPGHTRSTAEWDHVIAFAAEVAASRWFSALFATTDSVAGGSWLAIAIMMRRKTMICLTLLLGGGPPLADSYGCVLYACLMTSASLDAPGLSRARPRDADTSWMGGHSRLKRVDGREPDVVPLPDTTDELVAAHSGERQRPRRGPGAPEIVVDCFEELDTSAHALRMTGRTADLKVIAPHG